MAPSTDRSASRLCGSTRSAAAVTRHLVAPARPYLAPRCLRSLGAEPDPGPPLLGPLGPWPSRGCHTDLTAPGRHDRQPATTRALARTSVHLDRRRDP